MAINEFPGGRFDLVVEVRMPKNHEGPDWTDHITQLLNDLAREVCDAIVTQAPEGAPEGPTHYEQGGRILAPNGALVNYGLNADFSELDLPLGFLIQMFEALNQAMNHELKAHLAGDNGLWAALDLLELGVGRDGLASIIVDLLAPDLPSDSGLGLFR